ncbi:MAG: hypothetical protein ACT4PL_05515, partial [Phycisphaerales bacterium]
MANSTHAGRTLSLVLFVLAGSALPMGCTAAPQGASGDREGRDGAVGSGSPAAVGSGGAMAMGRAADQQRAPAFPQYPCISPDGSVVVFSHAGDLYAVEAAGGMAVRLTSSPADEERSCFSPTGETLAFDSERDGPKNVYAMAVSRGSGGTALVAGDVRRVTLSDRPQSLTGFSADGRDVLFTSNHEPGIFRSPRMYRAAVNGPAGGGSRMDRLTAAFGTQPRATPDGKAILFTRGRVDTTRPAYSGSGAPDIYRMELANGNFVRLTTGDRSDFDAH